MFGILVCSQSSTSTYIALPFFPHHFYLIRYCVSAALLLDQIHLHQSFSNNFFIFHQKGFPSRPNSFNLVVKVKRIFPRRKNFLMVNEYVIRKECTFGRWILPFFWPLLYRILTRLSAVLVVIKRIFLLEIFNMNRDMEVKK